MLAGPILESKGMRAIFRKRAKMFKKWEKNGKIFENLGKNEHLQIFRKRAGDCVRLSHAINC